MSDFAAECKHLAAELERVTAALREIADRSSHQDGREIPGFVIARVALAGGAREVAAARGGDAT
jgi:hypothetical protein